MIYGMQLPAGSGYATTIASIDFETYSTAGFVWDEHTKKWGALPNAKVKGLPAVNTVCYAEHPSTEVLCLAYDLKDNKGPRQWTPNQPLPLDLFEHLRHGKLIEAWNIAFEFWIWNIVCVGKYGFLPLKLEQCRCAMAKSRAFALPGKLENAGKVLDIKNKKDKRGTHLINRFCIPRNPTLKDNSTRILPESDLEGPELYQYNLRDIIAEDELSIKIPDLTDNELEFWYYDQLINIRGVQVDIENIKNCIAIIEEAYKKYNHELNKLTNGAVNSANEIAKLLKWLKQEGLELIDLSAETLGNLVAHEIYKNVSPKIKRVISIRRSIASASVRKLYAMLNQASSVGRLHNLFVYHSARTGRAAGAGPQPQNLPNHGPEVTYCSDCKKYNASWGWCAWCNKLVAPSNNSKEWNADAVENALEAIGSGCLDCVEFYFNDAIETISGCLRGLFIAAPGKDLICSDYSAIEAVVLAALAGEEWRLEVFRTHGKIYEMSASKITGTPFEEFEKHRLETGQHHPLRKKVGKVAELASGYQGWLGAWKQFGADEFFSDEEMKQAILAWRAASPAIVEMWGGQHRGYGSSWRKEYFGIEGAAIQAVLNPGAVFEYRGINYQVRDDVLYCRLLSRRYLIYHKPRLDSIPRGGLGNLQLSFMGWNTNPKNGAIGWIRITTYGGRLVENIVQATARDILAHAIVNLEKKGYSVVLHVHDEIVCEVLEGHGSLEEFEKIMSTTPSWASGWPIKASGGWRGKRYRK